MTTTKRNRLGLIGKKIGMTQVFETGGELVPVTVIQAGPCTVMQNRTVKQDGYEGVQLGFGEQKAQRLSKPARDHRKKGGKMVAVLREFRTDSSHEVGQELKIADLFKAGDLVDVTGVTKGRGFQGTIKRWNFHCGPHTHGSKNIREPGSVGQHTWPARVHLGKKMPGHMGNVRRTVRNLLVIRVDAETDRIFLRGAVPGWREGVLLVRRARHAPRIVSEAAAKSGKKG